jgi:hypothetical protein
MPILSWINPTPRISLKHILILSSHLGLGLPRGRPIFPVRLHSYLPSFWLHDLLIVISRLNHPDYITWTIRIIKFLIVEPSPLPIDIEILASGCCFQPAHLPCQVAQLTMLLRRGNTWLAQKYSSVHKGALLQTWERKTRPSLCSLSEALKINTLS